MVFQNKSVSWKSYRGVQHGGGLAEDPREYYRGGVVPSPLPSVPVSDQESSKGCG